MASQKRPAPFTQHRPRQRKAAARPVLPCLQLTFWVLTPVARFHGGPLWSGVFVTGPKGSSNTSTRGLIVT